MHVSSSSSWLHRFWVYQSVGWVLFWWTCGIEFLFVTKKKFVKIFYRLIEETNIWVIIEGFEGELLIQFICLEKKKNRTGIIFKGLNSSRLIFGDNIYVVKVIRQQENMIDWRIRSVISDIHRILASHSNWSFHHVNRKANIVAHNVAQWAA